MALLESSGGYAEIIVSIIRNINATIVCRSNEMVAAHIYGRTWSLMSNIYRIRLFRKSFIFPSTSVIK